MSQTKSQSPTPTRAIFYCHDSRFEAEYKRLRKKRHKGALWIEMSFFSKAFEEFSLEEFSRFSEAIRTLPESIKEIVFITLAQDSKSSDAMDWKMNNLQALALSGFVFIETDERQLRYLHGHIGITFEGEVDHIVHEDITHNVYLLHSVDVPGSELVAA